MKLEDKYLEKINEYFINEKPQWIVKLAHDLAEIKLKADKDKIIDVIKENTFIEEEEMCIWFKCIKSPKQMIDLLATEIVEALEVEK